VLRDAWAKYLGTCNQLGLLQQWSSTTGGASWLAAATTYLELHKIVLTQQGMLKLRSFPCCSRHAYLVVLSLHSQQPDIQHNSSLTHRVKFTCAVSHMKSISDGFDAQC
jgi:hypothetical protein